MPTAPSTASPLTRRTFLRVLGAGAIGAAVVQVLPALPVSSVGALTYEMLEAAYNACVIGKAEPSLMVVFARTARMMGLVYDVDV